MSNIYWGDGTRTKVMTTDSVKEHIDEALAEAKESGEFDGPPGHTPVKGEDYFTDDEAQEIAERAAKLVDGGSGGGKPLLYTRMSVSASSGTMVPIPLEGLYANDVGAVAVVWATNAKNVLCFVFSPPAPVTLKNALSSGMVLQSECNGFVASLGQKTGDSVASFSFTGPSTLQVASFGSYVLGGGSSGGGSNSVWVEMDEVLFGVNGDATDFTIPRDLFPADKCCRITIPIEWGGISNVSFVPRGQKSWQESGGDGENYSDSLFDGGSWSLVSAAYETDGLFVTIEGDAGGSVKGFYYEVL